MVKKLFYRTKVSILPPSKNEKLNGGKPFIVHEISQYNKNVCTAKGDIIPKTSALKAAWIGDVYVTNKKFKRKGYGRALLQYMIKKYKGPFHAWVHSDDYMYDDHGSPIAFFNGINFKHDFRDTTIGGDCLYKYAKKKKVTSKKR